MLFVSKAGIASGAVDSYDLKKRIEVVKNCRTVKKHDMKFNGAMPDMKVDPELYVSHAILLLKPLCAASTFSPADTWFMQTVVADGIECKAEAATSLPLTHQYFIY